MPRRKSILAKQRNTLIDQALLDIKSRKYKSPYKVEKILGLLKSLVTRRVNSGISRAQVR